jgi:hypothetical protein
VGDKAESPNAVYLFLLFSWVFVMLMIMLVHVHFSQDVVCIHHISLLNMIIARVIYPMERTGPPQITLNGSIHHRYVHGYASDDASCTDMRDCGDQATASIHDVSLQPVHIEATQCPIDLPCYIRLIILGVDGCLRSYTVYLVMPL